MEIRDKVIDDSYHNIIHNRTDYGGTPPFTFINCDFAHHFTRIIFNYCNFINCIFDCKSFIHNCYLYNCKFINCIFNYGSFIDNCNFYDCKFENIIFKVNPRECIVNSDFIGCNIDEAFKKDYIKTSPCPEKGEFIGWKKAAILLDNEDCDLIITQMELLYAGKHINIKYMPCIIKLLVPEDAKRSCGFSSKCRCDKAKVLDIQSIYGQSFPTDTIAHSYYDHAFTYKVGETVTPRKPFDDDPFNECSSGIHFFMSREEAVNYN